MHSPYDIKARRYGSTSHDDLVLHLEKVASERVGGVAHDIWDLHAESGRW